MKVVDLGGGLGGFQFVLAKQKLQVVNVDPGMKSKGRGWRCDSTMMKKMNLAWRTRVELRNCTMSEARLDSGSYDRVFCISVLEHLPEMEYVSSVKAALECLKVGGYFIITADLFLDLVPFTTRPTNAYGSNHKIADLVRWPGVEVVAGCLDQLYGSTSFSKDSIQSSLSQFLIGDYPALIQCLVLHKVQ